MKSHRPIWSNRYRAVSKHSKQLVDFLAFLPESNKLINVKTSSVVSMIVASTGSYTSLSYLAVNSKLTAYGAYSDSKTFIAKSIIIE